MENNEPILGFSQLQYMFLSNYYRLDTPLVEQIDNVLIEYRTVTQAYQASKFDDVDRKKTIANFADPSSSVAFAMSYKHKDNWKSIRVATMQKWLTLKFSDKELQDKLIATYPRAIYKYNTYGDTYWGVNQYFIGDNMLGSLLMDIRERCMLERNILTSR